MKLPARNLHLRGHANLLHAIRPGPEVGSGCAFSPR